MSEDILVLADMIAEFDRKQPNPGRETTAFIKRWQRKELKLKHRSSKHLTVAMRGINRTEIQNIREMKRFRDAPRTGNNQLVK